MIDWSVQYNDSGWFLQFRFGVVLGSVIHNWHSISWFCFQLHKLFNIQAPPSTKLSLLVGLLDIENCKVREKDNDVMFFSNNMRLNTWLASLGALTIKSLCSELSISMHKSICYAKNNKFSHAFSLRSYSVSKCGLWI